MLQAKLINLRWFQLVAISLWVILSLVGTFWWTLRRKQEDEFKRLYSLAQGGDVGSVIKIAGFHSSQGVLWLERLSQDQNAMTDSRVAAIREVGRSGRVDSEAMAVVLGIEHPFDVRHTAANLFKEHGCDDACVAATLFAMKELWGGQSTAEMRYLEQHPGPMSQSIEASLKNESEKDYITLLSANPCASEQFLRSDYKAEPQYREYVRSKVRGC